MKFYVILENDDVYCIVLGWNMKYYSILSEKLYCKGVKLGKIKKILSGDEYENNKV